MTLTSLAATITLILFDFVSLAPISVGLVSIKFALNLFLYSKLALNYLFFSGTKLAIQYLSVTPSQPF